MNPGYGFKCKMGPACLQKPDTLQCSAIYQNTGHFFEMTDPGQDAPDTKMGKTKSNPTSSQA